MQEIPVLMHRWITVTHRDIHLRLLHHPSPTEKERDTFLLFSATPKDIVLSSIYILIVKDDRFVLWFKSTNGF